MLKIRLSVNGRDWGAHELLVSSKKLPNFFFCQNQNHLYLSLIVKLTFPEKVEMVELKTSSQLQNVSITTNQKKDTEKEKGPNDPENKKEREETGELINF